MRGLLVSLIFGLLVISSFGEYFLSFPSLDPRYVFMGTYDLSNFGISAMISQPVGGIALSGFFSSPIDFNYDSMNFSASLGFQLFRSQSSTFLGYLDFAKFKDFAFGLSGLFTSPISGTNFYGGALYSFSNIPYFIINAGIGGKFSIFDVNIGGILLSDFQTFLSMSPTISVDTIIGPLLLRLGYYYQPSTVAVGNTEKNVVSLGIGIAPTSHIRYSVAVPRDEYFEDETVSLIVKRNTQVSLNTFGQVIVSIVDDKGSEVIRKEYSVDQENINIAENLKPGSYKVVLRKKGNFELLTEQASKQSFFVKGIPNARINLPNVITRKQKYEVNVSISSVDSYPSDISVKLDGREINFQSKFVPNQNFKFDLIVEELGQHRIEVYADNKKIGQHNFEVRNQINAQWINQPEKILTLQELALNPPKFKFSEIFDNKQEPYADQEVKFVIKKEGKNEVTEVTTFTDRDGIASVPVTWENGIYLIEVKPVKQEYTRITFSGRDDFVIRIEPTPKEMVLQTNESDGVYIDDQSKVILISKDKRNFELNIDIQDENGDSVRSGFLKVTMFKLTNDGKLKDISQDFNLIDRINLSTQQNESKSIRIPVSISPRAETGEYYLFFEIYNDMSKEAQSRWVEVYKVILYKDAILTVENLTIPGIVRKDVVIEGEPNKLKLVFMWKDGEPVRNSKVVLSYANRTLEGYTNSEGEMVILAPEPISDVFEFEYAISYNNFELTSGNKKLKVEKVERSVLIPSQLTLDLAGLGKNQGEAKLLMNKVYDFTLKDDKNVDIFKGRTSGYNIRKILNEVYLPTDPIRRSVVINLLGDQKSLLKINYSVYGIISGMKGKEYFLGTFTSGTNAQIPISTKISDGKEVFFDEFIVIPSGNYFAYKLTSLSNPSVNIELRPAKSFNLKVVVEDDEGTTFENPARYSIYYREKSAEFYVGSIMPGINATINVPIGLEMKEFINLLRIYREGYQIDFDVDDVIFDQKNNSITLLVRIVNQQELVNDFNLELTIDRNRVETPYEVIAHSENTFYGIPLYSKTIYERGRGKNYFGPTKNFNFIVYLPELGLNTYIEGVEVSPTRTKFPIEIANLANITLCHFNFQEIKYQGVKAVVKVDGKEVWKDTVDKNATFPVADGIHTIEVILDRYLLPIKIVKDFKKNTLGTDFKVTLVKSIPNVPPYLHKDVLYYPKEDSTSKLYRLADGTYQVPVEIMTRVKYLRFEKRGILFTLDNSYGFEKDMSTENRYRLRYGGKEKQLQIPEKGFIAIEFYPLDDNRVVLGFKPALTNVAENISLIFKSSQDYSTVGVSVFTDSLSESSAIRFTIPNLGLAQQAGANIRLKIYGYDKQRKFILPLDISKLERSQIIEADIVQVDGVIYTFSLGADPKLGNRTQRVYLKQPGEYYVEYVGTTLETLVIYLPDDLSRYEKGVDSYIIGY